MCQPALVLIRSTGTQQGGPFWPGYADFSTFFLFSNNDPIQDRRTDRRTGKKRNAAYRMAASQYNNSICHVQYNNNKLYFTQKKVVEIKHPYTMSLRSALKSTKSVQDASTFVEFFPDIHSSFVLGPPRETPSQSS